MTRVERDAAIAELVRQQGVDDATDRLWPTAHEIREADIASLTGDGGNVLDRMVCHRVPAPDARLIAEEQFASRGQAQMAPPVRVVGAGRIWDRPIVRYEVVNVCPVCHDKPLPKPLACLCCHSSAYDPKKWTMQETPKQADAREKLAGGRGRTLTPGKRGRKGTWYDYVEPGKVAP